MVFYYFKFEPDLFAANDRIQIMLPKFACKPHRGPFLVKIDEDLKAEEPPKFQRGDVARDRPEPNIRIEIEVASIFNKGIEGV